jgi:hypothetical protein
MPVAPAKATAVGMFVIRKEPPTEVASSVEAPVPASLFVTLSRDK